MESVGVSVSCSGLFGHSQLTTAWRRRSPRKSPGTSEHTWKTTRGSSLQLYARSNQTRNCVIGTCKIRVKKCSYRAGVLKEYLLCFPNDKWTYWLLHVHRCAQASLSGRAKVFSSMVQPLPNGSDGNYCIFVYGVQTPQMLQQVCTFCLILCTSVHACVDVCVCFAPSIVPCANI